MQIKFMKPIYLGEQIVINIKLRDGLNNSNNGQLNENSKVVNNFQVEIKKKAT